MRVDQVMTKPPVMVQADTPVAQVARLMLERGVRAVLVVDTANQLVGILTETDLLMRNANLRFPSYFGLLENLLPVGGDRNLEQELHKVLGATAREVMTAGGLYTAAPEDDLGIVAHEMVHRHLNAVPIVSADGHVEGVLYPSDVVRLIARE